MKGKHPTLCSDPSVCLLFWERGTSVSAQSIPLVLCSEVLLVVLEEPHAVQKTKSESAKCKTVSYQVCYLISPISIKVLGVVFLYQTAAQLWTPLLLAQRSQSVLWFSTFNIQNVFLFVISSVFLPLRVVSAAPDFSSPSLFNDH